MTADIIKGVTSILAGIAWLVGHHLDWDEGITHTIGWVFWLSFVF